jgi:Tol biopolymer transport system component
MSPEQVRGEKLDARTDLFSFGLVLYELATGKRAFEGNTGPELQEAILTQAASPARKVNPALPEKLAKILQRALEKDREKRYQSAAEMRAALDTLKLEIEPKHRLRWRITAAAGLAMLLLATATYWFAKRRSPASVALPEIKWRPLTSNSSENSVGGGNISPDGKYLAYADTLGIHVKKLETGETQAIPQAKDINGNTLDWTAGLWFPDGKSFLVDAFPLGGDTSYRSSQGSSIWIVSLSGGPPQKLRDEAYLDSISPDGSLISFETNKGKYSDREIWVMQPDGQKARRVFEVDENSSIGGLGWPQDGQRVIFARQDGPDTANTYFVSGDLKGGPLSRIVPPFDPARMGAFIWLPDGRLILRFDESGFHVITCNLWQIHINPQLTKFVGKLQRRTNFAELCVNPMNATADSKRMVATQWRPHSSVFVGELQDGGTRITTPARLTLDESWNHPYAWTADSKAVLFLSTRAGVAELLKQSLGQDTAESLITLRKNEGLGSAFLSPEGSWILYTVSPADSGPSAPDNLMRVPITGGSPQLVLKSDFEERPRCARSPATLCAIAERSADRKQLVFTAFDPVKGRGRKLAKSDTDPTTDYHWDLSPDGTRIALLKNREGRVRILSLNGGAPQEVAAKAWNTLSSVVWTADGKDLFVSSYTKRGADMLHMDLKGNVRLLWEHPGGIEIYGVPSPDGRHLAMRGWNVESNVWLMENF